MFRCLVVAVLSLPMAVLAAPPCPASFAEFLAVFERELPFQRAHTRFPLSYSYVDAHAHPEPQQVAVEVTRAKLGSYPGATFPSPARQGAIPLERRISFADGGRVEVRFDKPDTDHASKFQFKAAGACWVLVRVDNMSL